MVMPERLDRLLTYAATGVLPIQSGAPSDKVEEKEENRFAVMICLLLALAAVGMFLHRIAASLGPESDAVCAVVFLALGLFVLRAGVR